MPDPVQVDIDNHVATVTLSRPDKRNALSLEMFEALSAAGKQLAAERALRAVVLTGAGEHFCAGIDTSLFAGGDPAALAGMLRPLEGSPANLFQHAAYAWRELPVPVIAALRGVVFGAGLQVAMGADIRIAAPDVRCSVMEIRWGIVPDMALTATMRRTLRADLLAELTYTGRIVEAAEAREIGLVTTLADDPLAAASQLAAEIAGRSPDAVRAAKRLLSEGFELDVAAALRLEATLQSGLLGGANQREAVQANIEKRAPKFRDPG